MLAGQPPGPQPAQAAARRWLDEDACAADARALARALASAAEPDRPVGAGVDAFLTLRGDLGAGKTTFARHLLHALGVRGRIKSPTYALVETYDLAGGDEAPHLAHHFDLYRFQNPGEWPASGLDELLAAPGLKLMEWPERASGHLPPADLALDLSADLVDERSCEAHRAPTRTCLVQAHTARGERLLTAWHLESLAA